MSSSNASTMALAWSLAIKEAVTVQAAAARLANQMVWHQLRVVLRAAAVRAAVAEEGLAVILVQLQAVALKALTVRTVVATPA